MNKGNYGFSAPPNASTRVSPPEWRNYRLITVTTSGIVVPQNVYQIKFLVFSGGGNALAGNYAGVGGGYAEGVVDVIPGQVLPTITVGAAQGTSSVGAWISATGGNGVTPGTGTVAAGIREPLTATGGGTTAPGGKGGASSGSPYGDGVGDGAGGGNAWGRKSISERGASTPVSSASSPDAFIALINKRGLPGYGAASPTDNCGIGCGSYSQNSANQATVPGIGGGGAFGATTGQTGGVAGGGGYGGVAGPGGPGLVIMAWTEGY